ncbi:MAG: MerR family transcriptional regulator [Chloroflexi bacterium]|nr:MerR family transcriptional regulator [Chloroflexota bacterium]
MQTYTIGQLAAQTGLTRRALRLYEKAGLLVPLRGGNNYRYYTEQQLKEAAVIRELREAGLSLHIIGTIFAIKRAPGSPEQKLARFLGVLDEAQDELIARQQAIDAALQQIAAYREDVFAAIEQLNQDEKRSEQT